ncbi:MAG: recombinase family protein, partial [bacterium]
NGNDYMTKAMRQIVGVFAELEKNRIADRLVRGRRRKAKNGKKASGNCPLGYKYHNGKVVIDKQNVRIIEEIFKLYLKERSIKKVMDIINDKDYRTQRGNKFSKYAISKILRNDFYKGIVTFDNIKTEGEHRPIINSITFGKVQARLDRNRKR